MATPASTSFDLLGPLVVTVAGTAVRLGGPRQVAVLARLLLTPGQVVSMEQLAESVWDGDLPARPEVAIRSYISNLRRSIEPARHPGDRQSCIESIAPGYRLAVDPGAIDAHRFEQLVAQGRSALGRGEAGLAASHLASALRLWRGEPCEGLVDTDALMAYRARLAELRLVATEQWFEARLAQGEHEALTPDLEAVLAEHPRRERLTELAMLALYRAGRQSEALAACQRLRSLLVEQLGIDPGPRVQALEHKILIHDPSLLAAAPPAPAPADGRAPGPDHRRAGGGDGPDQGGPAETWTSSGVDHAAPAGGRGDDTLPLRADGTASSADDGTAPAGLGGSAPLVAGGTELPGPDGIALPAADRTAPQGVDGTLLTGADSAAPAAGGTASPGADDNGPGGAGGTRLGGTGGAVPDRVGGRSSGEGWAPAAEAAVRTGPVGPGAAGRSEGGGPGGDGVPDPGFELVSGRTRELAVLAGLEVALDQGRSATVVVTGEPGSGKSTLLGKVADRGSSAGAAVAWGRCREVARAQVLWPWSQILQHLAAVDSAERSDDPESSTEPDPALNDLVRAGLVAAPYGSRTQGIPLVPPRDPGEATALFPVIVGFLRRLAARRPILVVIDDAQWADEASVELLAFAGPALSADRVAFAVAWRSTEDGPSPVRRALRDLARLPGLHRIELAGLPVEGVAELVAALRPDLPQPAVLASALHRATAGNPFLVRQMLQSVTEAAAPGPWPPGPDELLASVLGPAPPTTVQEQIALRAERAHPSAPAVLTVAALSPTPLTAEVVAEAVELPLPEVEDALEQAVQAGLLMADSPLERTYRFVHPVAARALTAALTGPRLARLHAALGHARWRAGGPAADLVHHFARARSAGTSLLAARFALLALHESTSFELVAEAEALAAVSMEVVAGVDGAEALGAELALVEAQMARLRGDAERQRRAAAVARGLARRSGGPDAEALALLGGTGPHPAGPAFAAVAWSGCADAAIAATWPVEEPVMDTADEGWWALLAARRARLDGRITPPGTGSAPGRHDAGGTDLPGMDSVIDSPVDRAMDCALWRERALAALETGTDEEVAALAAGPPAGTGDGGVGSHDRLLAGRLAVVAGLADPGEEDSPGAATRPPQPGPAGPPRSVLELDRTLSALGAELVGGRLGPPDAELIDRLALWSARSGIAPQPIRWLRCLALWERGSSADLEAEAAGAAGADELLAWLAVAAAEGPEPGRAGALLDRAIELDRAVPTTSAPVGGSGRWGRAERCLLLLAAARAGHGPAVDHFGRRLNPGPAVASTMAGLAVIGPVDWFRGVGALAVGDSEAAATLFRRADGIARRHRAPTWRVRALAGLAEAAARAGHGTLQIQLQSEASALAAGGGAGWLDRWAAGPGAALSASAAATRLAASGGLQSTSNRFATR